VINPELARSLRWSMTQVRPSRIRRRACHALAAGAHKPAGLRFTRPYDDR